MKWKRHSCQLMCMSEMHLVMINFSIDQLKRNWCVKIRRKIDVKQLIAIYLIAISSGHKYTNKTVNVGQNV